jgi:hypothetical protein
MIHLGWSSCSRIGKSSLKVGCVVGTSTNSHGVDAKSFDQAELTPRSKSRQNTSFPSKLATHHRISPSPSSQYEKLPSLIVRASASMSAQCPPIGR